MKFATVVLIEIVDSSAFMQRLNDKDSIPPS